MVAILVEKYRVLDDTDEENEDPHNEILRKKLCKKLGLAANCALKENAFSTISYPELTGYDLAVWKNFLPATYGKRRGDWKAYRFDCVPLTALKEIERARESGAFTDIEIWTPETVQSDPLAVGVLGNRGQSVLDGARFFQIVRWGESLLPKEEIERRVTPSFIKNSTTGPLPAVIRETAQKMVEAYPARQVSVTVAIVKWHCMQRTYCLEQFNARERRCHRHYVCGRCGVIVCRKSYKPSYDY